MGLLRYNDIQNICNFSTVCQSLIEFLNKDFSRISGMRYRSLFPRHSGFSSLLILTVNLVSIFTHAVA